jgi:hypothetical protein
VTAVHYLLSYDFELPANRKLTVFGSIVRYAPNRDLTISRSIPLKDRSLSKSDRHKAGESQSAVPDLPNIRRSQRFLPRPSWVPTESDLKRRSINMSTRWVPKGFHTITPNIVVDDAEQAVAFFKKASAPQRPIA